MPGIGDGAGRLLNKWRSKPSLDWLIVIVFVGAHFAWVQWSGSGDLLGQPKLEQRLEIYTTGATVVAIVGSFVIAAIAQYSTASGQRMRALRAAEHLASQFRRNWVSILSATLVIAGACLLATILDVTEGDGGGVHWLVETALILGSVRALRLVWLFNAVLFASDLDLADQNPGATRSGS
ncbi:hypothetical protein ACOKM3_26760 [Streptomyces sp. BH106]|uniref:hypothetical protein n=1 Tax=Streptomyces sp. BH106 TaxID=3410409 RepID=UPI003CF0DF33